jgi:hypothetical protein
VCGQGHGGTCAQCEPVEADVRQTITRPGGVYSIQQNLLDDRGMTCPVGTSRRTWTRGGCCTSWSVTRTRRRCRSAASACDSRQSQVDTNVRSDATRCDLCESMSVKTRQRSMGALTLTALVTECRWRLVDPVCRPKPLYAFPHLAAESQEAKKASKAGRRKVSQPRRRMMW